MSSQFIRRELFPSSSSSHPMTLPVNENKFVRTANTVSVCVCLIRNCVTHSIPRIRQAISDNTNIEFDHISIEFNWRQLAQPLLRIYLPLSNLRVCLIHVICFALLSVNQFAPLTQNMQIRGTLINRVYT